MCELDIENISINPELLLCPPAVLKKIKRLLRDKTELRDFASLNTPFVYIREGGRPELISHHYIYLLIKHSGEHTLQVRCVDTVQEINAILSADRINVGLIEKALLFKSEYSAKARTHQKRRIAGQICPLCGGPLEGMKTGKGSLRESQKYFKIRCHYRHYKDIMCNFTVELIYEEYDRFRRNEYPTKLWLVKLDKRCPKCNKDNLYERRMPNGQRYHQCEKTLVEQSASYGKCDFREEIVNEQS